MRIKVRITTKEWFPDFAISYYQPRIIHVNVKDETDSKGVIDAAIEYVKENLPPKAEITMIENLGKDEILQEKKE